MPATEDRGDLGTARGLKAAHAVGVDRRAVLDAAVLGVDCRHVGAELLQDRFALAGLGGDDGEYVNHGRLAPAFANPEGSGQSYPGRGAQGNRRTLERLPLGALAQPIAYAGLGEDISRPGGVGLELVAQIADEDAKI